MTIEQQNAFTAHYQRHNVYQGLRDTLAKGVDLSNINAFVTTLWESGLSIAPAEPLPRPSFSVEDLDALNLPGYDRLAMYPRYILAACVNVQQNAWDFGEKDFAHQIVAVQQDPRHQQLDESTVYMHMCTLVAAGFLTRNHYHFKLSDQLASTINVDYVASQPQPAA